MTKIDLIRALRAAGYSLVKLCRHDEPHDHMVNGKPKPCKTPGKVPVNREWEAGNALWKEEDLAVGNYGVVLGSEDLVVDVDPRRFSAGDRPLPRLFDAVGGPLRTFVVRTGGGGLHIYLKRPAGSPARNELREYPGIEFKAGPGRQVVGPGCAHVSGGTYAVVQGEPAKVAAAPVKLLELIAKKEVPLVSGTGEYKDDDDTVRRYGDFLSKALPSIEGFGGDDNAFRVACRGRDLGLSPQATYTLLSTHWNPRCVPVWEEDELRAKVENAYRYASGAVGSSHPAAVFAPVEEAETGEPQRPNLRSQNGSHPADTDGADAPQKFAWKLKGPENKKEYVTCFQNVLNFFELKTAKLRGVFGFNEFSRRVEFVAPPPWRTNAQHGEPVQDVDLSQMRAHLSRNHGYDSPTSDLIDAMVDSAQKRKFHPVREYLDGLKWDGQARLDEWLIRYCGVEDDAAGYSRAVARKTLVAAVARVYEPGCKFDHVLVLEGTQGIGKSAVCKILGGEWFADFKVDVDNKDTLQMMQGKWIVEMAELHTVRQTDTDAVKAFLTRQVDEARFAYGRLPQQYKRQGIFIATYNPGPDGTYLKDDENRRWWPVRCSGVPPGARHFDFAGLAKVRDQLFAEAAQRYKKGESLTMETVALQDAARAQQAERRAEHPWADRVAAWLAEREKDPASAPSFLTPREIWVYAMGGLDARFGRREQLDAARAMRDLGWTTGFRKVMGRTVRGYWRPQSVDLTLFGDLV